PTGELVLGIEAVDVSEDLDEGLLRQIFGELTVPDHTIDEREYRPLVTVEQLTIRLLAAGGGEGDQIVVGCLYECQIQRSQSRSRVNAPYAPMEGEVSPIVESHFRLPRLLTGDSFPVHSTAPIHATRCRTRPIEAPYFRRRRRRPHTCAACSRPSRRATTSSTTSCRSISTGYG